VHGVGSLVARVVRARAGVLALEFADPARRRDALIRKLFAGGYHDQPEQCRSLGSSLAILRRMFVR
jgi:hypothetical protein